ncbi:SDR family NAD(P)-dependent oxidoreductase [Paraburkholderia sp. 32]|uniref:SDR family NAD(P)-dependent oxidoreductase n=1 Tax=Paraburkholderia sp. 32 TaxID=2991057 RepID=UPI003D1FBB9C
MRVPDLGSDVHGNGGTSAATENITRESEAMGGEASANSASVTSFADIEQMLAQTVERWGRVDILVTNGRILRDKS